MLKVNDREDAGLDVEVDVPLFGVNIEEEHLETAEAFSLQFRTIESLLVAHDFLKHVHPLALIEEKPSLSCGATRVLLGQENEKALGLVVRSLLRDHSIEQGAYVLVAEIAMS